MKNVNLLRNKDGKIWINVASGTAVLKNYINLEKHLFLSLSSLFPLIKRVLPKKYHAMLKSYRQAKLNAIVIKHDCRKLLPFPDACADHIVCSHFLEHVYPDEMMKIVRGFYKILMPGGTLHVIIPDIHRQVKQYLDQKAGGNVQAADELLSKTILSRQNRGSLKYRFLEFFGGFGLQHYWMYDYDSMFDKLKKCGFVLARKELFPSKDYKNDDPGGIHFFVQKPA